MKMLISTKTNLKKKNIKKKVLKKYIKNEKKLNFELTSSSSSKRLAI